MERRKEAARNSDERYKAVFDAASDGIALQYPATWAIADVNRAMCDMYGYAKEEIMKINPALLFSEQSPPAMRKAQEKLQAAASGHPQLFDWQARHRDGHTFWVQVSLKLMKVGMQEYVLSIVRDVTDRKKIEQELRDSKASFEQAQQLAHLGSWRWDAVNNVVTGTAEAEKILGVSEPLTQEEFIEIIHPEDRARIREAIRKTGESELPFWEEFRFLRRDGSIRWVYSVGKTIFEDQKPLYSFGTIQDITDRKRFEQELQESEADLAQAQQMAHLGSWRWDVQRDILKMSDEGYSIIGLAPGEIELNYSTFLSFIHPDDREAMRVALNSSLKYGDMYRQTHRLLRRDGSVRWVQCRGKIVFSDGRPVTMLGTMYDITERKAIEDRLRQRDLEVTTLLDSLDAFAFFKNTAGVYVMVNRKMCDSIGRTREEVVGKTDYDLFPQSLADRYVSQDRAVVESGEPIMIPEDETFIRGHLVKIATRKVPLRDAQGYITGVIGVAFDITEIKNAERAVDEARAQAELFLDLMGHDINNMNQVAQGYLEMALNKLRSGEQIGPADVLLVEKPLETLESSSDLIRNVKKLQRARSENFAVREMDIGEVLTWVRARAIHAPGRDIIIDYRPAYGLKVMANELVRDLFTNIVTNAVKHSDPKKSLHVRIFADRVFEAKQEYYKISVEDNGPGIPDDMKRQIFSQIKQGRGRPGSGGLGLYLVSTLARQYNGRVWVEDRVPGDYTQGSRFVVMLPAHRAEAAKANEAHA